MFSFKTYSFLHDDAAAIRKIVFVDEQGFIDEFDDHDAAAKHIVLYAGDAPAGCCRHFEGKEPGIHFIGRFAVLKEFRGQHCGKIMLEEAERQIRAAGGREARLAAQSHAAGFYEKAGYLPCGSEFLEQNSPHIPMRKILSPRV